MTADTADAVTPEQTTTQTAGTGVVGQNRGIRYLLGAICVVTIALMVAPLLMSFLASIKTKSEASQVPPSYIPHTLSLENINEGFDLMHRGESIRSVVVY